LNRNEDPYIASESDRRLAQLKVLITSADEKEKSIKKVGWVFRVWKRMHVVEPGTWRMAS
jgi:hypothetical protein